jgi:antitoxin MazE
MFKPRSDDAMTEATLDIKAWGNSLGVRIPAAVARAARLRVNQRVTLTVEDGRVVITPQGAKPLGLEERVARYDATLHGGEFMAGASVGAERW